MAKRVEKVSTNTSNLVKQCCKLCGSVANSFSPSSRSCQMMIDTCISEVKKEMNLQIRNITKGGSNELLTNLTLIEKVITFVASRSLELATLHRGHC